MRTLFKILGAALLAGGITVLLVIPGTNALAPVTHQPPDPWDLMAVVSNESDDAVIATVAANSVDPTGAKTVRLYFSINIGSPGSTPPPDLRTVRTPEDVPLDAQGEGPDSRVGSGITIVLSGAVARAVQSCDDEKVNKVTVGYDDLSDAEARAVVEAFEGSETTQAPRDGVVPEDAAWLQASEREYVVLRPQYLYGSDTAQVFGDASGITFIPSFNYWSCEFSSAAFIDRAGTSTAVFFPKLAATIGGHADRPGSLEVTRTLSVTDNSNIVPVSLVGQTYRDRAGLVRSETTQRSINASEPVVWIDDVTLEFVSEEGSRTRDRSILVAGIAIAIVAGLVLSILKQLAPNGNRGR